MQQFQTESRGPATIGELSGLEALKAKMEAQEAAAEGPVGEEPSESQSAAVEAEVEGEPVQTEGKGSTAMEDKVGMGNRGSIGKDPDEMRDTAQLEHPTEPSAKRTQRVEEGGDYPPAEKSQAALKTGDLPEEGTLAADAEDATDDVTPTTAATAEPEFEGPNVDSPDDVETPEMMDQPADEAVAEATGSDDEEEGTSAEMGKADATVTGDDAEAVAEEAEEEKEA